MILNWHINGKDENNRQYEIYGAETDLNGPVHIRAVLPKGTLSTAVAEIRLPVDKSEKIFMNGYQTWTYCPEYSVNDRIRGLHGIPRKVLRRYKIDRSIEYKLYQKIIDQYQLDKYSDYHFVQYPFERGITHGFSWCYFRNARNYRLIASLDERPGYTIFMYDYKQQLLTIRRDCSGLKTEGEYPVFDLYFGEGGEKAVFDGWFDAMDIRPITDRKLCGYSSWYNRYQDINDRAIRQDLQGCMDILEKGDLFQIDDGWEPYVGDWLAPDTEKFPHGMKAMVDEIHAAGYEAGLWLAPFVAETKSTIFKYHPEWFLRHDDEFWFNGSNWSGFCSLDIDNPEVIAYLEKVFDRVFNEWGFDLVKLDFLYGAAPFGNERETRAGRMYRAVDLLRKWAKDKKILGCGVPVMPAFGKFEYCRISCDVSLDWDDKAYMRIIHRERVSTKQAIGNTISRRQLNERAYLSDPDVFFLRDENCDLSAEQKDLLAVVSALLGGVFLTSDDPSSYTDEMKKKYRYYRSLTEAVDISVETDPVLKISYTLDGKRHTLVYGKKY